MTKFKVPLPRRRNAAALSLAIGMSVVTPLLNGCDGTSERTGEAAPGVASYALSFGPLHVDPSEVTAPPMTLRRFRAWVDIDAPNGDGDGVQAWFWAETPPGIYAWAEDQGSQGGLANMALWVEDSVPNGEYQAVVHAWLNGEMREAPLVVRVQKLGELAVELDPTLVPDEVELPPHDDGRPRPLARAIDERGYSIDFVADELLVTSEDPAALRALLDRTGGQVVREVTEPQLQAPTVFLVRIPRGTVDPARAADDLRALDPRVRGTLRISSRDAMELVATAARETLAGVTVSPNFILESHGYVDRVVVDGPKLQGTGATVPYQPNVAAWPHFMTGGVQNIGVVEAWRALAIAGKLIPDAVKVGIVDGGFNPAFDLPKYSLGVELMKPNPEKCGDKDCAWHGTHVAQVGFAIPGNGVGTAGPGGPVAELGLVQLDSSELIRSVASIYKVLSWGPRVVNLSGGKAVPAILMPAAKLVESVTKIARQTGVLVVAAAGNKGKNVDEEDCAFGVCWEEAWHFPCENDGVLCVGGVGYNSLWRHSRSNWGNQVDLFGPYVVYHGAGPGYPIGNDAHVGQGTSHAAPFVSGVAALIMAANPGLSVNDVEARLLDEATSSYDGSVRRLVNAYRSVKSALGNVAPLVRIDTPAPGATVSYGGIGGVNLVAEVDDVEDGPSCCTVTWTSNVDGTLGSGRSLRFTFKSPGTRVITVTATDSSGLSSSQSVTIQLVNNPPRAEIQAPTRYQRVYRNTPVALRGRATDPNEVLLPCSSKTMLWTSTYGTAFLRFGCEASVTFPDLGWQRIRLSATDAYGLRSEMSVWIEVVDPPGGAPTAAITSPGPGGGVWGMISNTLTGTGTDPDGDSTKLVFSWSVVDRGTKTFIGTGRSISWRPLDTIPSSCGGRTVTLELTVTDTAGLSTTVTQATFVNFPPC
ncbi:MAG: S8 family serine peptidase [Deltaproteobacteria bacterium]|nr:S8 family serine peptidase [Deltaproteobacteria bacterium]